MSRSWRASCRRDTKFIISSKAAILVAGIFGKVARKYIARRSDDPSDTSTTLSHTRIINGVIASDATKDEASTPGWYFVLDPVPDAYAVGWSRVLYAIADPKAPDAPVETAISRRIRKKNIRNALSHLIVWNETSRYNIVYYESILRLDASPFNSNRTLFRTNVKL